MLVSQFTQPYIKAKKKPRDRTTYRAARRNVGKIDYRRAKRQRQTLINHRRIAQQ